ncbi:MAG TPA: GH3 auxin-responsive promoter family protein [Planctomycetota bacterium]|nr:GH3 auxin-responsive promoter family protein [Planctomycetota bacterium]
MFQRVVARSFSPLLSFADRRPQGAAMAAAQARILRQLVNRTATLPIGRALGLDRLPCDHRLVEAFRQQVAETTYADHAPFIDRVARGERDVMFPGAPIALAQTSGTTSSENSGERYIPQNAALLRHHARGGSAAFFRLLQATGGSLFSGQLLMLGGSTALTPNAHGIPVGDLSGIVATRVPAWLRPLYEPGLDIALESDWERKLDRIAERCGERDVRLVSGIPAWCLMLFERLCRRRGLSRARVAWPNLGGFIHGGHSITPFIPSLREHLAPDTWLMEVYPASEAFIAVGSRAWRLDEHQAPPLDLLANHGVYLEFAPQDGGDAVGAEALEDGRIYRVLLTIPGGLIRYQLGDLVEGAGPGRVRVAGRIKTRISVFGEHVEGVHLDNALASACLTTRSEVAYYHVAPWLPTATSPTGAHEWLVEFVRPPSSPQAFTDTIDHHLRTHVLDYDAHRVGGQISAPRLTILPSGTFHRYLAGQGKLGGQHKVPQAWKDRTLATKLMAAAATDCTADSTKATTDRENTHV